MLLPRMFPSARGDCFCERAATTTASWEESTWKIPRLADKHTHLFPFGPGCQESDESRRDPRPRGYLCYMVDEFVCPKLENEEPANERCDVECDSVGIHHGAEWF